MKRILFVCHGNICRSPMAAYILKDRINKYHLDGYTESRAVSYEEEGNDIYPPAKRTLEKHKIKYDYHKAKRITKNDYDCFDLIYVMEEYNLDLLKRIVDDRNKKLFKLCPFDIEDPWYTGNYEKVFSQISERIDNLINELKLID